jgi:succinate dehydrogenase / fumarate reductase, cytochrome b subunit
MATARRPLSPHLQIYRFAYTMALSILHRATGLVLSLGLVLLVAWLAAAATGPECYAAFLGFAGSWPVKVLIAGGITAFCFHLCNGIRHLLWDLGVGMERAEARRSGRIVVAATLLLAAALVWIFLRPGATP